MENKVQMMDYLIKAHNKTDVKELTNIELLNIFMTTLVTMPRHDRGVPQKDGKTMFFDYFPLFNELLIRLENNNDK